MRYHFPRTLKAAEASERSQWAIGDALLKEADDRQSGERGMNAVSKELEANGIELSAGYLAALRATALAFPANRRHALPWKVHSVAGTPDTLDVIVRGAKKDIDRKTGEAPKVTIWYVGEVLQRQRNEQREERRKASEAAQREVAKARAHEHEARERTHKAKDADERKRAERDQKEAAERRRQAVENARAAKAAPAKLPPTEEDVPFLVARTRFMTGLTDVKGQLKKLGKEIEPFMDEFTLAFINAGVEDLLEIANQARALADTLRKHSNNKRGHLSVIGE
jgi:site-specific DNA-cytosine methylase